MSQEIGDLNILIFWAKFVAFEVQESLFLSGKNREFRNFMSVATMCTSLFYFLNQIRYHPWRSSHKGNHQRISVH